MAASCSSLQTSDSAPNDSFGSFMRNLEEKLSGKIDKNYFSRQKGVVLRKYLVLHGVQTSDLGKAYNKEQLSNLAFQAWKLRLQEISADSEDTSELIRYARSGPSAAGVVDQTGMVEGFFKCSNVYVRRFVQLHDYKARLRLRWIKSLQRLAGL